MGGGGGVFTFLRAIAVTPLATRDTAGTECCFDGGCCYFPKAASARAVTKKKAAFEVSPEAEVCVSFVFLFPCILCCGLWLIDCN